MYKNPLFSTSAIPPNRNKKQVILGIMNMQNVYLISYCLFIHSNKIWSCNEAFKTNFYSFSSTL